VLHRDLVSGDHDLCQAVRSFFFPLQVSCQGSGWHGLCNRSFCDPRHTIAIDKRKAPEIGAYVWCLLLLSLAGYVSAGPKRCACAVLVQPGLLQTHPRCLHHHPKSRDRQPRSMNHRWQAHRRGLFRRCCSWTHDSRRS
jgi:hypothetical protein